MSQMPLDFREPRLQFQAFAFFVTVNDIGSRVVRHSYGPLAPSGNDIKKTCPKQGLHGFHELAQLHGQTKLKYDPHQRPGFVRQVARSRTHTHWTGRRAVYGAR